MSELRGGEAGPGPSAEAIDVFASFAARIEAGESVDFDELCAEHAALAQELRTLHEDWRRAHDVLRRFADAPMDSEVGALFGDRDPPRITLPDTDDTPLAGAMEGDVLPVGLPRDGFGRYEIHGEIARGGMGRIVLAHDGTLRRSVAMKLLAKRRGPRGESAGKTRALSRFLEEAQITAQLDHPGIVPVHELGVSPTGELYFTMKLVRGRELSHVIRLARKEREGWNRTRLVGVLQRVCEAMAYAHSKGVIHRDLKPANVMVRRFGEVLVMDWGLARVMGQGDPHAAAARPDPGDAAGLRTSRSENRDATPDELLTREGSVIGTIAFMSPEQAAGLTDDVDYRADVYAVGAILYEALTGEPPYVSEGDSSASAVLRRVLDGPPRPVHEIDPSVPEELEAICDRAMARDPERRYAGMEELGEELRAYLEGRVVRAHRTGARAELAKWVGRNRGTAATLAALFVALVAGALVVAGVERERRAAVTYDRDHFSTMRLSATLDELFPIHPDRAPDMRRWLEEARSMVAKLPHYREELEGLEVELEGVEHEEIEIEPGFAILSDMNMREILEKSETARLRAELEVAREEEDILEQQRIEEELEIIRVEVGHITDRIERAERQLALRRTRHYAKEGADRLYARAHGHVRRLEELAHPELGGIAVVEQRLERAATLRERSIDAHREEWDAAVASIADPEACPLYDGLEIEPQVGLVPLGRDPESGLWEFWHVVSGERPVRDLGTGRFRIEPETGIVLVLIPGGTFVMGVQPPDTERLFDLTAHEVELSPYFLSKYEMTQAQWLRATGATPSIHFAGADYAGNPRISRSHPVEGVSWFDCTAALARWGLTLPTEAQWERAARGGTDTVYWSGNSPASLATHVNSFGEEDTVFGEAYGEEYAAAYSSHAPVDAFSPNPWGLHDVSGNVREWCRDSFRKRHVRIKEGTGEHVPAWSISKALRGGGFKTGLQDLQVARRGDRVPQGADEDVGVRPCAPLVSRR